MLSISHADQIAPLKDEVPIPEFVHKKERLRTLVRVVIARRRVDLICEESDPLRLSIAQEEAFKHNPRIPWKNIYMTSEERLEAGIWGALLNRPYDLKFLTEYNAVRIEHRIPEDDIREEFFKNEILKTATATGAKSVLVLCGDMHTEPLKAKLEAAGRRVETSNELISEKHWK